MVSGSALTRSPISRSDGADRGADDVADDAHARVPDGVLEAGAGVVGVLGHLGVGRAEVAQQDDDRGQEDADGAEQRVADQRAPGDAGLLGAQGEDPSVASRSSSEDRAGWRISTISWSPISLRAHWMMPMPMSSSAKPSAVPRATLEAPRPRTVSWLSPPSSTRVEVGDDEQHRADRGEAEQRRRPGARRASRPSGRRRSGARCARAGPGSVIGSSGGSAGSPWCVAVAVHVLELGWRGRGRRAHAA